MLPVQRAVFSPNGRRALSLCTQTNHRIISPVSCGIVSKRPQDGLRTPSSNAQFKRLIHVTRVNRDLEAGLRALGAGIAAAGPIGSGIGLGIIFGNLLAAMARNPSIANKAFTNAIMGAAFCESLGLFSISMAFVIMP